MPTIEVTRPESLSLLWVTQRCRELYGFKDAEIQPVLILHQEWLKTHRSMSAAVFLAELDEEDPYQGFQSYWNGELTFIESHTRLPRLVILWILLEEAGRAVALGKEREYAYDRFWAWVHGQTIYNAIGDA